jgi:tetratricopeptide (TPR) repeat protein
MYAERLKTLIGTGKPAEARAEAISLIEAGERTFEVFACLATANRNLGEFDAASAAMRQAAALRPDDASAWLELGELLVLAARWTESLRALRIAAELEPDEVRPWLALANAQLASRRIPEAIRTSSSLLERFPSAPESHLFRATLERSLGRRDEALISYQRALELDPRCATALLGLSELERPQGTLGETVRASRAAGGRTTEERTQLEFALAKLLDAENRVDEAFRSFAAANAMQREALARTGITCRRGHFSAWTDTARARFPREVFRALVPRSHAGTVPIFILGMPRSGTTLVERILSAHPEVAAGGELAAANVVYGDYLRARSRKRKDWPVDVSDETELRLLADAREQYADQVAGLAGESRYLTDKHPGNAAIAGFLHLIFPEAPLVHVRRNALATCWSIFTQYLPSSTPCFTALEDIAFYQASQAEIIRLWRTEAGLPIVDVRYESVVDQPATAIRALVSCCGLPWSESCLQPELGTGPVLTASVDQVRSPIHRDRLERHRRYARYLEAIEPIVVDDGDKGPVPSR